MLKNYCLVAWRSLMKNKLFSFINIAGLSIGLSACMLILIYIRHELSYDRGLLAGDRLYQVGGIFVTDGKEDRFPCSPAITAANLGNDFPEIAATARMLTFSFFGEYKTLLQSTRPDGTLNSFYEPKGSAADNSFLTLFNYNLTEGDLHTALTQPNTVIISTTLARTLYGAKPALNRTLRISSSLNGVHDCRITGVFQPAQTPSHADPHFILSMTGGAIEQRMQADGTNMAFDNMYTTYVQLKPGVDAKRLEAKFPAFIDKYAGKDLRQAGFWRKDFLLPVSEIHLHADMMEMTPGGNPSYLYILGSVAAFILLLACINFMNLSTARSHQRAAEVGVRKVLGAQRTSLVGQFLGESLLMSALAFLLALGLVWLLTPVFQRIAGQKLNLGSTPELIVAFAGLALLTGLLAGCYPAFYLSSFSPASVLKGKFSNSFTALFLRKTLVVFQFVISVILIIVTLVISDQLHFLQKADLGFAKDRQLVIPLQSQQARTLYRSLKTEWQTDPRVLSVGAGAYYPGIVNASDDNFHKRGQSVNAGQRLRINHVDEDFLKTLDIPIVAGRSFDFDHIATDTLRHVIINEEAVKKIGFASPQAAVGDRLISTYKGVTNEDEIVGVVKDFHYESLHAPITPFVFYLNDNKSYHYAIIHLAPTSNTAASLASIENTWKKGNPGEPFTYSILDDDFQVNYSADKRLAGIINSFATIAILISCLGLFGLTTFSTEQRTREISIRKVLGARVSGLVFLLSKGFLRLVFTALVIAIPIAWWIMHRWLSEFTARVPIGWSVFLTTAALVTAIAFATISAQVIRTALANPSKALRSAAIITLIIACPWTLVAQTNRYPITPWPTEPKPYGALPTPRQLAWHEMEMYCLIHFGVDTYTDKEWGYGDEDPAIVNPVNFDARQIVGAAKAGGFKGVVIVAKHHDGLCIWPTKTTEHNITKSPWRNGHGDMIKEYRQACDALGMKMGLYCSPWDRNNPQYGTAGYVKTYRAQLTELYTHYGPLFISWHDGANGGDGYYGGARETRKIDRTTYYGWDTTWGIVRQLQPGANIFGDVGPDVRWVGNEEGHAGTTSWATYTPEAPDAGKKPANGYNKYWLATNGTRNGEFWLPAECDVPFRPGWFFHPSQDGKAKTPAQLLDLYYQSVGRGADLDLGLAPNREGRLDADDVAKLQAFGALLKKIFTTNLAKGAILTASNIRAGDRAQYGPANLLDADRYSYWATDDNVINPTLTISLPKTTTFNVIRLRENIKLGQRIDSFAVDAFTNNNWETIATGTSIGANRLLRLPQAIKTNKLRLRIVSSPVCIALSDFGLFLEPSHETTQTAASTATRRWKITPAPTPHDFIIDMAMPQTIKAFTYLPNNHPDGVIDRYVLYSSPDGANWQKLAEGEFGNIRANPVEQLIPLDHPQTARYLKFSALHVIEGNNTSAAEIGIVTAIPK